MAFPVNSSSDAGENHQHKNQAVHLLQRFPSAFQRPGFIPLPREMPRTELQQLLGRARGRAGAQQECSAPTPSGQAPWPWGMRPLRHGQAACPSPPWQECRVAPLEPLPERQRGTQQLQLEEPARQFCTERLPQGKSGCSASKKGVKVSISTAPLVLPSARCWEWDPPHQALKFLWDEDKGLLCGMKIKILLLKEFNRPYYQRDAIRTSWAGVQATLLPLFCTGLAMPLGCTLSLGCILVM